MDYFKRQSPLRRWKFLLSVALPALAILWLAFYAIRSDRRAYSAGSLSSAHAVLTKQCAACHVTQLGFFTEQVIDQKCLACHDGPMHHATQAFAPACASCHTDHRGAIRLAATSDANCAQCHANLTARGTSTNFTRNIDSFESNHPEFAVLRAGHPDPGTIQLNHYRHLQPDLLGPRSWQPGTDEFARIALSLRAADANRGKIWQHGDKQSSRRTSVGASSGVRQQMERVTSGRGRFWISKRELYMAPATYARTCAACHTLQF